MKANYILGYEIRPEGRLESVGFNFQGLFSLLEQEADQLKCALDEMLYKDRDEVIWHSRRAFKNIEGKISRNGEDRYQLTYGAIEFCLSKKELATLQYDIMEAIADNEEEFEKLSESQPD